MDFNLHVEMRDEHKWKSAPLGGRLCSTTKDLRPIAISAVSLGFDNSPDHVVSDSWECPSHMVLGLSTVG